MVLTCCVGIKVPGVSRRSAPGLRACNTRVSVDHSVRGSIIDFNYPAPPQGRTKQSAHTTLARAPAIYMLDRLKETRPLDLGPKDILPLGPKDI